MCFEARLQMERVTEKICQRHDKIVKILTPHHLFFPKMRNDKEERRCTPEIIELGGWGWVGAISLVVNHHHSHHCHHLSWSEVE